MNILHVFYFVVGFFIGKYSDELILLLNLLLKNIAMNLKT